MTAFIIKVGTFLLRRCIFPWWWLWPFPVFTMPNPWQEWLVGLVFTAQTQLPILPLA